MLFVCNPHNDMALRHRKQHTAANDISRLHGLVKGADDAQDEMFSSKTAFPLYSPREAIHARGDATPLSDPAWTIQVCVSDCLTQCTLHQLLFVYRQLIYSGFPPYR